MTTPEPRDSWSLDTPHIGGRVLFFDRIDSTNTTAARLAPPEGSLVVVTDYQAAGRGQFGRVWQARPGSSLLMSVVLKPPPESRRPVVLTAFAAIAVGEAIYSLTGVQTRIKWPNDLLFHGKKVCGILIENTSAVVIGIGLNLTQSREEFAAAGLHDATSLGIISGKATDVATAADVVIRRLDAEYGRLLAGERVPVEADWKWRVGLLGRQVAVELTDGTTVTGRLRDMGFDGLELETGELIPRVLVPEVVRHISPFPESV